MKKSILNLGKALNKAEQKNVTGGTFTPLPDHSNCNGENNLPMGCLCTDFTTCAADMVCLSINNGLRVCTNI